MPKKVCVFKIWELCYLPLLLQLFSLFYCRHYYRCPHFPFPLPPSIQTLCPFCLAIVILLSVKLSSLNTLSLLKCSLSFSFESISCLLNYVWCPSKVTSAWHRMPSNRPFVTPHLFSFMEGTKGCLWAPFGSVFMLIQELLWCLFSGWCSVKPFIGPHGPCLVTFQAILGTFWGNASSLC